MAVGGIEISGTTQLEALARDLRRVGEPGRGLRRDLRVALRGAAAPIKSAAQQNVLATPSKGTENADNVPHHLRADIARLTKIATRLAGSTVFVRVFVDKKRMPAGQQNLPDYLEGSARRPWAHPLFGDREHWIEQEPCPYFTPAVDAHLTGVYGAAVAVVEKTALTIERGKAGL